MRYYGNRSLSSILKKVLDVMLLFGIILFLLIGKNTFTQGFQGESGYLLIWVYVLFLVGSTTLIYVVFQLRKIVQSLIGNDPFTQENVHSLRRVWQGSFIIATCYFINFFINASFKNFRLIYLDVNGIHTDFEFFIFFFAGIFLLILEKVFHKAVAYKEDHDLTI